jgi:nitroreductase
VDLLTALRTTGTTRAFDPRPVPDDLLLSDNGRWPGPGPVDLDAARRSAALRRPIVDDFGRPPVLLVVLVELAKLAATDVELNRHGIAGGASIYPFCWQIVLAARAEGLGGAMTTIAVRFEPEMLALVGAPTGWAVASVIALGYARDQPTRLKRKLLREIATVDRFDGPAVGGG